MLFGLFIYLNKLCSRKKTKNKMIFNYMTPLFFQNENFKIKHTFE